MKRFFRDVLRRLIGTTGEEERAERAKRGRQQQRMDAVIAARAAQVEEASARMVEALNSMRHKDNGT